jgi:hypothetical protein
MRRYFSISSLFSIALLLFSGGISIAQPDDDARQAWNRPVKPFRAIGNIYYVGAEGVASYLITTPQGHVLLDSGFAETVPRIQDSLNQLGFKLEDVKVLINSHAHSFALMKTLKCDVFLGPHGSFFALDEKRTLLEKGAKTNPFIDPQGYRGFIDDTERAYHEQLTKERKRQVKVIRSSQVSEKNVVRMTHDCNKR